MRVGAIAGGVVVGVLVVVVVVVILAVGCTSLIMKRRKERDFW